MVFALTTPPAARVFSLLASFPVDSVAVRNELWVHAVLLRAAHEDHRLLHHQELRVRYVSLRRRGATKRHLQLLNGA